MSNGATWGAVATEAPQVSLSALEHYAYCGRQAGLILLEDCFADDAATVRGTLMHQRVDQQGHESRPGARTLYALPVWNDALGLTGICDVVEVRGNKVVPVEHKSGRYEGGGPADLQLAGQAMCLEEMFGVAVPAAYVWSGRDRRRHRVAINQPLRDLVVSTAQEVRALITSGRLPGPAPATRCRRCSMAVACMPRLLDKPSRHARAAAALYTVQDDDRAH